MNTVAPSAAAQTEGLPLHQHIFAFFLCAVFMLMVVMLVRRRRLDEMYSLLWIGTTLVMFILVLRYDWLVAITHFVGMITPASTLFLCALFFLILTAVMLSVRESILTLKVKNLTQELALLRQELEEKTDAGNAGKTPAQPEPFKEDRNNRL